MQKITVICSLHDPRSFSLIFPWLVKKKYFSWHFPNFPWQHKFPDIFQFSLTCRNPEKHRLLFLEKISTSKVQDYFNAALSYNLNHKKLSYRLESRASTWCIQHIIMLSRAFGFSLFSYMLPVVFLPNLPGNEFMHACDCKSTRIASTLVRVSFLKYCCTHPQKVYRHKLQSRPNISIDSFYDNLRLIFKD